MVRLCRSTKEVFKVDESSEFRSASSSCSRVQHSKLRLTVVTRFFFLFLMTWP